MVDPLATGIIVGYLALVVGMIVWAVKSNWNDKQEDEQMVVTSTSLNLTGKDFYTELEAYLDSINFEACENSQETVNDPRYQALCYLRDYIDWQNDKNPLTLVREILANRSVSEDNLIFCDEILRWCI